MPYLKQIAGHGGTGGIRRYLEKGGRALARDFFNLSWDERECAGMPEELKGLVEWDVEMDAMRRMCGNDEPWKGRQARTFKHFVISPDPGDSIALPELRALTHEWVNRYFPTLQVAIVYHDDNEGRIPHAHVVVNNTDLETGRRMQHERPEEFNLGLQRIAAARGLSHLENDRERGSREPLTGQSAYTLHAERRIREEGGYSWVADIRARAAIAKALSRNEEDFRALLSELGVTVSDSSARGGRADWIYALADEPSRKVGGERLGAPFGKQALQARFGRMASYRPSPESASKIEARAKDAVEVNDLRELDRLGRCVEACRRCGARSIADLELRIESERAKAKAGGRAAHLHRKRAEELRDARDYARAAKLLPETALRPRISAPAKPAKGAGPRAGKAVTKETPRAQVRTRGGQTRKDDSR